MTSIDTGQMHNRYVAEERDVEVMTKLTTKLDVWIFLTPDNSMYIIIYTPSNACSRCGRELHVYVLLWQEIYAILVEW